LFELHGPSVLAYARRRTDRISADDVTSEVFVIAWRRLDEIPEDALPWLLGCARKVLANQRRSERRRDALRDRHDQQPRPAWRGDNDTSGAVFDALGQLSDRDRELLLLVAWDGLDHGQAATVLGCTRATVSVRLHRARTRLARALAHPGSDNPTSGRMEVSQ
jgi:RNA polymerase sigma-70 factor, ECF subfamily